MSSRIIIYIFAAIAFVAPLNAQPTENAMPQIGDVVEIVNKATAPENLEESREWSGPIKLVIVFALLAILPSLMAMMTSFTRIVIVLGFIRRALSTQNIPPTIVMMGLALFLTLYTMSPTLMKINKTAIEPYLADEILFEQAGERTAQAIKEFMLRQTRQSDLMLFVRMANITPPQQPIDIPLHVVVPSFIISEFRTAFEIGCLLFIPFLLIDLVIASILLSAGMMMLPPVMISLPFKLILFILVDGWGLLAKSLSLSFN